ncbi:MAG TPA: methyltransferase domain-containing protein [Archangium sp.]|uniref:class I SAM-dependent methyltransferase n=1 Tax=Archangium sp. TaxID=1872627 RepID=UPI002E3001C3|nr:methyltransferase domain-containing protein [Archangium sp.]HEX5754623.1 methyltransferase domain-containing protein [Archangium sp.]
MSTQYDGVAEQYSSTEEMPLRIFVEVPRVLELLGELRGKSVLDLACGSGFLTRLFRQRGVARVVGADLSEDMSRIARQQAAAAGLDIEYRVHDVSSASLGGDFDLVSAVWLLHYAGQPEALERMCQNIHDSLKPGGHLVALVPRSPRFTRGRTGTGGSRLLPPGTGDEDDWKSHPAGINLFDAGTASGGTDVDGGTAAPGRRTPARKGRGEG